MQSRGSDFAGTKAVFPVNDFYLDSHTSEALSDPGPETVALSEFGSFFLEWHALSARTGDVTYGVLADNMINTLKTQYPEQVGHLPTCNTPSSL